MALAANQAQDKHQIRFVCRRCQQPLKIDLSFDNIHEQSELINELTAPLIAQADRDSEPLITEKAQFYEEDGNLSRRIIEPRYSPTDESNEFTLIGEPGLPSLGTLGHKPRVKAVLFDVMTGQSTIDHPLCEECTDTLLNTLDDQLKLTEEECRDYRNFLERLDSTSLDEDDASLDDELLKLKAEEHVLREQLKQVAAEQDQVHRDILREREKTKQLDEEEERYWREYNEYKRQVQELDDEQRSVDNQLKYAQAQLDRLKKTNVFNATFHIWHSGHFGTINNFRLGRLKSAPVDWSEINAAWGQTVLLLHSLAKKMNLTFKRYRLVPYGSHSYLESLTDKSKELPLYGSGGFRFFWDAKFDQAMVAFLDCVQQFKEEVEKGDSQFCLPYRMEKDRIEDNTTSGQSYSIKIQFNSEEKWTKALKFMLTNLKWGLAWVSSQFANK